MLKKISLITFILIANISFLFAEKYSVYVISPAVGTHKNDALKETYVSTLQDYFNSAGYTNQFSIRASLVSAGIDALLKSPDKNSQIAGKVLKAREDRFIVMVAVDELTEEICNKLGLKYNFIKLAADGVVTLTVFDKNDLTAFDKDNLPIPYVTVGYGKLEKDYNKICKKLVNNINKQFINKQSKKK